MPAWLHLMGESLWPLLYAGLVFTVPLTIASFALGLTLAFATALVRLFGPQWAVKIARFYVWLIRGSPLLVQLFVIFYGLPSVGIVLDPLTSPCPHWRTRSSHSSRTRRLPQCSRCPRSSRRLSGLLR